MIQPSLHRVPCPDPDGGHQMAYWEWNGTGNPEHPHVVLCVHGLSRQGRDFDVLARRLCDRARVIAVDVAGRGHSDWLKNPAGYGIPTYAADMVALIAQLKPGTLDWVGTSMGGLIGMAVCGTPGLLEAAAAPGRPKQGNAPSGGSAAHEVASVGVKVRKLVLNDVGPRLELSSLQRIATYVGKTGHFQSVQEAADAMWAISTGFGPHTPEQWLALSEPMTRPHPEGGLRLHYDPAIAIVFKNVTPESAAQGDAALWQLYDRITADTLVTRGAESDLLSPATAQAMAERGPKARVVEFAGVGHAPTLIAEDQLRAVEGFLFG